MKTAGFAQEGEILTRATVEKEATGNFLDVPSHEIPVANLHIENENGCRLASL